MRKSRRCADRVNLDRFKDLPTGGDVVYQGEEVFTGRPHATEDAVKYFLSNLLSDPRNDPGDVDEQDLGLMAASYFQIKGIDNPTHPLWDWVDDVMDDTMKRRHSSVPKEKKIVGEYQRKVRTARMSKEMLRGFEFAQPVEFIYPDTGHKGFGRIMDFSRAPEGIIVSIAPHLYQESEQEEWFRRDPHDFVSVLIDNVFPTEKPFRKFIMDKSFPPKLNEEKEPLFPEE